MRAHKEKRGVLVETRKMPKIILDSGHDRLPKKDMEQFIDEINKLIDEYNSSDTNTPKLKITALGRIQIKIKEINDKYSAEMIGESPNYFKTIHKELFEEIREQYKILGVNSLLTFEQQKKASPLSEIIANMSPDKANELLDILINSTSNNLAANLGKLYPQSDKSSEAIAFRTFLSKHEISVLGGKNSKNFKVTPIDGSGPAVLKVEDTLGNAPKYAEALLREKIGNLFAPVHAERQVVTTGYKEEPIGRTLLVTDHYTAGSLDNYGAKLRKDDEPKFGPSIGKLFEQMAGIMLGIQNAGCFFPDSKIDNWLIDDKGQLRIADTKSLLFTDNGAYKVREPNTITGNEYCDFLGTPGYLPPEFFGLTPINADNVHAFILGVNLYEFATGQKMEHTVKYDKAAFKFDAPFFQTANGVKIQALIEGLVKPNPTERMHVREALDRLFIINNPEFDAVFSAIKDNKGQLHATELEINEFILELQEKINKAIPSDKIVILNTLIASIAIFTKLNELSPNNETMIELIREKREEIMNLSPSEGKAIIGALQATADNLSEAKPLFDQLNSLKFGLKDEVMNNYIREKREAIMKLGPSDGKNVVEELKAMVTALKADAAVMNIRETIDTFRAKDKKWSSVGMNAKADRIETAMSNVSIQDRCDFLRSGSSIGVEKALASHRRGETGKVHLTDTLDIDTTKAAQSFKDFKKNYKDKMAVLKESKQEKSVEVEQTEEQAADLSMKR
jgi:serine/threonine protein kinase